MNLPVVEGYKCPDCNFPRIKRLYNYALHRGFKHGEWQLMKEWCKQKNYEFLGARDYGTRGLMFLKPDESMKGDIFYERLWNCAVCHQKLLYNATKKYVICPCKKISDYEIPDKVLRQAYKITRLRG